MLYSRLNGGVYLSLQEATLLEYSGSSASFLTATSQAMQHTQNTQQVDAIHEDYYNDTSKEAEASQARMDSSVRTYPSLSSTDRLEQLLLVEGLPIAKVPTDVMAALLASGCVGSHVTPGFVRWHFSVRGSIPTHHPAVTYVDCEGGTNVNSKGGVNKVEEREGGGGGGLGAREKGEGDRRSKQECLADALFLLQYSFLDICSGDVSGLKRERERQGDSSNRKDSKSETATFSSLQGLSILPLEDGTLGVILEPTCEPLYLVNSAERRLLERMGGSIVAADSLLGAAVSSVLRDPLFPQHCNIRPLTPVDTLKLLRSFLPSHWFDGDVSAVTDRGTTITDEWLALLWTYVVTEKAITLFEEVFPLLPILSPSHLPPGSYLVRVSQSVPVLHSFFSDLSKEATDVLSRIGVHILDSSFLGISQDIGRLVSEASPKGLLHAVCVAAGKNEFHHTIENLSIANKRSLRNLFLDRILSKLDLSSLSDIEKNVLLSTPIWERHTERWGDALSSNKTERERSVRAFGPIYSLTDTPSPFKNADHGPLQIPPKDVDSTFLSLGGQFLVLRGSFDRSIYLKLGLLEPTKG